MFADDTGCIYVHGPTPPGMNSFSPNDEPVILQATVKLSENGIPYLEVEQP